MFEKAIEIILSGVVIPVLLELWRDARKRNAHARLARESSPVPGIVPGSPVVAAPPPPAAPGTLQDASRVRRVLLRIIVSSVLGVVPGAFATGFVAGIVGDEFPIFGAAHWTVTAVCVALIWKFLTRYGPLKAPGTQV